MWVPTRVFFTKGTSEGHHRKEDKNARDRASFPAAVDRHNLETASSVTAGNIRVIDREEYLRTVPEGAVCTAINGITESRTPGQIVSAAMAWARPIDRSKTGFIVELFGTPGIDPEDLLDRIEQMAIQIYMDQYGRLDDDPKSVWVPRQVRYDEGFNVPFEINRLLAVTKVPPTGDYACAIVAAVLLP
jgi:pyruvoyl-dependent arginine decarboxylase